MTVYQKMKLSQFINSCAIGMREAGIEITNDMQPRPAKPAPAAPPAPRQSAWEQIEAAAAAHVRANGGTKEQAIVKVLEDNPALYAAYQAEPQPPIQQAAPRAPAPQPAIWDTIDTMAKQRAAADGCTYAVAVGLVCEENPALYRAYQRDL